MGGSTIPAPVNRQHLFAIVILAAAIAMIARFDVIFEALSGGSALRSIALIAGMALSGAWFAARLGMKLELHGPGRPALVAIAAAIGMTVYVLLLDCLVFR